MVRGRDATTLYPAKVSVCSCSTETPRDRFRLRQHVMVLDGTVRSTPSSHPLSIRSSSKWHKTDRIAWHRPSNSHYP
jgi:hypothetical protein